MHEIYKNEYLSYYLEISFLSDIISSGIFIKLWICIDIRSVIKMFYVSETGKILWNGE